MAPVSNTRFRTPDVERLLGTLFEHSPDGVLITRPDGSVLRANPAACRLLQRTEAEIIAAGRDGLVVDDERLRAFLAERERSGLAHGQILHRRPDGSTYVAEQPSALVPTASGEVYTYIVFRDITEQRRAREIVHRYQMLRDHSRDVILFSRRDDGKIIDVNAAGTTVYGWSAEEWPRLTLHDLRAPTHVTDLRSQMDEADQRGIRFETMHRRKDGTAFPVEVSSQGADIGGTRVLVSVIRDVSERKAAQAAQARSEARFRALFANSRDALTIVRAVRDGSGEVAAWEFADVNDTALRTFALGREQLVGQRVDRMFPERMARMAPRWREALDKGVSPPYESSYDGSHYLVSVYRLDDESICVSGVDVTAVKRAEQAARESEERFRDLADNIAQLAWMADERGSIFWYNRRWLEYTGTTLEEMGGKGWRKVHHPDHLRRVIEKLQRCLESGEAWEDTFPLRGQDGQYRWFLSRALPIRDESGRVLRWFGTHTDVSGQREAQRALEETSRRKSEFIGILSHELRNPLAPIRNGLQILETVAPDSAQAARSRAVIARQVGHLTRLVDDLLDVNRISSGKIELRRTRADLRALVRQACDDQRSVLEEDGIALELSLPEAPVWVDVDATRIAQVVGNLLQNAAKFSDRGARAIVSVSSAAQAEIRVRDTGIGMEPALVERMFEPFAQADQTLARTRGGLGLGLALVKGLVELHGGTVTGRSEGRGSGAEFLVRLPLAETQVLRERAGAPAPARNRRTVLVIEDNRDAGETLKELLELDGHRAWLAADGKSGVALAREHRPEVVICDIGLPDMSGYEVARILRGDPDLRGMRLIALTGYAQPSDRDRAREAGFDAHLAKPPSLDAIDAALA